MPGSSCSGFLSKRERVRSSPAPAEQRLHQHDSARVRTVVPRRRACRATDSRPFGGTRRPWSVRPTGWVFEVGGHAIATYQSAASLYEVGFNHFFRGKDHPGGGDHIFIQAMRLLASTRGRGRKDGSLPISWTPFARRYARTGQWTFLLSAPPADATLLGVPDRFHGYRRHQLDLPGPVQPLHAQPRHQGHIPTADLGLPRRRRDGRAGVARGHRTPAREELDNLTWVINCNLQQLDGPVRGQQDRHKSSSRSSSVLAGT